jgi:hypothetical protein
MDEITVQPEDANKNNVRSSDSDQGRLEAAPVQVGRGAEPRDGEQEQHDAGSSATPPASGGTTSQ